jgi:hypothetical protein
MFTTEGTAGFGEVAQRSLSAGAHKVVPRLSRSAAPGGYCHALSVGDRTKEASGGLPLVHLALNEVGPDRLIGGFPVQAIWKKKARTGNQAWTQSAARTCVMLQTEFPTWLKGRPPLPWFPIKAMRTTVSVVSRAQGLCPTGASNRTLCIMHLSWSTTRVEKQK